MKTEQQHNTSMSTIQRVMIIGRSGSGKSTFAIQLQKKLKIQLFHLDKYFFEENWIARDYQEFLTFQREMVVSPIDRASI